MAGETPETRLAVLEKTITKMEFSQQQNFAKLFKILEGEGTKPGIKTCVQLQDASLKRLYKWVTGLTIIIIAAVEEVVRRNF